MRHARGRRKDSGYMLLFLMLAVAVLTITMLGVARNYRRSILRDREVEMIHRGEQYSRAVKRFYKKNGRYPISIEQLENTNKIRYLRKRYKDPMSADGAWKLVHATDIQIKAVGALAGTGAAGATNPLQAAASNLLGAAQNNPLQANSGTADSGNGTSAPGTAGGTNDTGQTTGTATSDTGSTGASGNAANGQVLGGGDVWGVVSKAKTEGFHSFGDKTKYNEWFFIYVPALDTGKGLITGPYNPKMFIGSVNSGLGNPTSKPTSTETPGVGAPGTVSTPPASTSAPSAPTQ